MKDELLSGTWTLRRTYDLRLENRNQKQDWNRILVLRRSHPTYPSRARVTSATTCRGLEQS